MGGPGTNWGARRAEQFSHLGNYTLTRGREGNSRWWNRCIPKEREMEINAAP